MQKKVLSEQAIYSGPGTTGGSGIVVVRYKFQN